METGFLQGNGIEALPQFLTSLAIGLLIGLERERNPSAKAGLRTFALVAVLGTLLALLSDKTGSPWLVIAGLAAIAATIIAAYLNDTPDEDDDPGTTTVVALLLSYCLGVMVWFELSKLAVMLAIGVTALLYFKPELRGISQKLMRRDLVAVLQFAVLTFIVLPILPNQNYGPYDAFNPHQAWLMVVLISGISLAGYAALHVVGTRYGAPLLGMFGGLTSSTATTLIYARHGKSNLAALNLAASVIVIASMVLPLRLMAVSAVVARGILPSLIPVLAIGLLFGLVVALYNWHKMDKATELFIPETTNPAELHTAVGFGLLYVAVLLISAWMVDVAGSQGLYAVAVASGLTDVDAIVLSSLRLFNLGQLNEHQTVIAIALAFLSNLAFKYGMVVFIGGWALARQVAIGFGAIACGMLFGLLIL
ncbi:MAG: MgtC/SapB family protein [Gammaproteobacteria bacterium]|nr:MgtC/SapB family protein [Gammaproteobacteria bacterium]MBU1968597.1 MgtC/SapB family protein [Gammaproteobacteria bacterium]